MKTDTFTKLCLIVITLSFVTMGVTHVLSYRMSKIPRDVRVVKSVALEIDSSVDVRGSVEVSGGELDVGSVSGTVDVNVLNQPIR
jgi:hypothetical protein